MKRSVLLGLILVLLPIYAFAQPLQRKLPEDSYFFNPDVVASNTMHFLSHGNTKMLQASIDALSNSGGGVLIIEPGVYVLDQIHLKSNVHIKVASGVVFKSTATNALFRAGYVNNFQEVTNWSVQSLDGTAFTFDFSNYKSNGKIRAFQLGNTRNFKISDFKVLDNFTKFNAITTEAVGGEPASFPTFGIVENIAVEQAHYGYGVVQVQVAQNILFRNLSGTGGVTLRLESGYKGLADRYLTDKTIVIDHIYGRQISCKNGAHAVMLSPHTIQQGMVDIRDVNSISCEAAVAIGFGFLSAKKEQLAPGYEPGTFSEDSVIAHVSATFGNEAQVRAMRLKFIPCALRKHISVTKNPDEESFKAPSLAAVYNLAVDQYESFNNPVGTYKIVLHDIKHTGFSSEIRKDGIIVSSTENDFENCSAIEVSVFIKPKERNTINPLQKQF
ncbi:hypothetical protein JJL45_04770 [Tamlana sp. s12]|uniref:hypothetical protein n=1 Tax=Tamlana sp. s12 TaxID=1630406 RepID=UPI00192CD734|nr:hypothetical protein [Tamlana sp. s12]QQY83305.1 hypothetical protein JJL45_04770 [Tamlana sp. s12]